MLDRPVSLDDKQLHAASWSFESAAHLVDAMAPLHALLGFIEVPEAAPDFLVDLELSSIPGILAARFATRSRIRFRREIVAEGQIELHFVENGRHIVSFAGNQFEAPAGSAYAILTPGTVDVDIDASSSGTAMALSRHACTALISHGSSDPNALLSSFKPLVHFQEGSVDVLRRMADLLTADRTKHVFWASPSGAYAFRDAVLTTFISAWPSETRQVEAALYPGSLKRALSWIDDNLGREFSMEELAGAAGTSMRTLQMYFREYFRTPPSVFVNRLRLEKVRQDLLLAGPHERVGDIATRWSFHHMGHFANMYKNIYGESPSATRSKGSGTRIIIS